MASFSAVINNVKSFPRNLLNSINSLPPRKRIVSLIGLSIFILLILFIIGYAIYLKATENQIVNYATLTYLDESNVPQTIISNPATINILDNTTSGNVNISYQLQGIDAGGGESASLKFNVFQLKTKDVVIPEQTGTGSSTGTASFTTTMANGNYDFCLKATSYLTKCLTEVNYNSSTPLALNFNELLCGDLNESDMVELFDFGYMASKWHTNDIIANIDKQGSVNIFDYGLLIPNWGKKGD
jgi:hypothetical protein